MIDESSSLRGVFLKLESKKITPEKKHAEYIAIEAMLGGDSGNKLIQSLQGINVYEVLAGDISVGSPTVLSIISIVIRFLEANSEMVGTPLPVLRKLVMILESNSSEQKSPELFVKTLKCLTLMCPALKSLGKEGPVIKSILLRDIIGNQSTDVSVKLNALRLFRSLNQYKLIEGNDHRSSWLNLLMNFIFDDNLSLREAAIDALSAFKVHITGNEEYLDTLANNLVPAKYCKMLTEMIATDKNWAVIWRLLVELLGRRLHTNSALVNSLLAVEEKAFKTLNMDTKKDAFISWNSLVLNFALDQNVLTSERRVKLLTIPLRANNCRHPDIARAKLNVWWSTIRHMKSEVMNYSDMVLQPFLIFCFGQVGESNHMSSNGQNRLNGPNAGESSAKLYPVIRVPCLHALCEIVSRSADMPLPRELSKELAIPALLAPPITNQKVFCSLSRLLTQCLGEAVMLEGCNMQQTPYIIHCWKSLLALIGHGPGDAMNSSTNDSYSKDLKTISMVKELLRLLVHLVESSSSVPEGKSIGHVILSMMECMVAGEYALPISILNSHTYAVSVSNYLGMNSSPSLLLSVLFLSPVFSNDKQLYPRVKETFSKVLSTGMNCAISPLPFARGLLKKVDACATEQPSTVTVSYLQEIWMLMANHLSDAIDKDCAISEGNDAGHDLHCIHGMLMFPLSHLLKNNLPQESFEPVIKTWKILFELYFINAQLLVTTQSSDVVEELCRKIHVAFKKSVVSFNCIANAVQFLLIMYRKPFCDTYWKGELGLASKVEKVHGLCNSQQLVMNFLYKVATFLSSWSDRNDGDEERMSDHKSIISFLVLVFTLTTSFNFSNFMQDKGLICVSFYLKLMAEAKYKTDLGDEMIKLWEQFLEYMEKKALVVPHKIQSTVDLLTPMLVSALKHPLTKLANVTMVRWNRSLGELCSSVKISKSLSDTLNDVIKDSSGSEDVFGKLTILDKSPRLSAKHDKHGSPSRSTSHAKMDTSRNKISEEKGVEFKIILPKPKTPVLTEHQKEMRKERSVDIPALYQDLTQDSMSQCFSQENSVLAVSKAVTCEVVKEDAKLAFPVGFLAKQNLQAAKKTTEPKTISHEADTHGIVSNSKPKTTAGDKKLQDLTSSVAMVTADSSVPSSVDKSPSNDSPMVGTESKPSRKQRRRKQQNNITADNTDSPGTMTLRNLGFPAKTVENGLPLPENYGKADKISSPLSSTVVAYPPASVPPADDVSLTSSSSKGTGQVRFVTIKLNASGDQIASMKDSIKDTTQMNPPEKKESNSPESKASDDPCSSASTGTEEDCDINMAPSGSPDVARKHLRKSIPKKLTNLQSLKNSIKRSMKENESPSGSSRRKESSSLSSAKTPLSPKRRGRPKRRTMEGQLSSENVDAVKVPLVEDAADESVQESSKDRGGSNLSDKRIDRQNQNAMSSSPHKDNHQEHLEVASRVLPEIVVENVDSGVTLPGRLGKDGDGVSTIKISSPRKLSVTEFTSTPSSTGTTHSRCNEQATKEAYGSSKSTPSCPSPKPKITPVSPRFKSVGSSPSLDKWLRYTNKDSDEKPPKDSTRNSSMSRNKLGGIEVITLDSISDNALDTVVKSEVNVDSCLKTCVSSISEDIVDSSQDPLDSSSSSVKSVTKKCAVHLPRVCDNFPNEVTLIPYEGRMLKCNLSPSKIEDTKIENDLRKSVLSNSSPVVTNLFSPRNSNSRGARILSMAQGNKEKTTAEEGSGSPLGDVDSSRWSQHNNSSSSLQDSPLSHYRSPELNLTPPMKKPRRIRSLYLGNVSPQCRALEIGCLASEGEVAVHSYSPNASPGGSLMKKKRPLESDDSVSPSSKKTRRVSFADPIVSRQVEFCIPDSERKFKKRAVSRCLKLPCMPQDDSTEIVASELQPTQSKEDTAKVSPVDDIMQSAKALDQSICENLNGEHDHSLTDKPSLQSKVADINRISFKSCKEGEVRTSECNTSSEIDKSVSDTSKNLMPAEECVGDKVVSVGPIIEKESGVVDGLAILEPPTEMETQENNLAEKEQTEKGILNDGHESRNISLNSGVECMEISPSQTEHPTEAADGSENKESSTPSPIEDTPIIEPAHGSEIQTSAESAVSPDWESAFESLSATEKQSDSSKSSESPEMSLTDSFAEEPRSHKLNTQEEVFPPLRDCKDPLSTLIPRLASKIWRERCRISLENRGINTIGDLSRLTEDFVDRIPIRHNKWNTLKSALEDYYTRKCEEGELTESSSNAEVNAAEDNVETPCEMEVVVTDDMRGTIFREMLSKMSPKEILGELKNLNLTEKILQEIENEKVSAPSQELPNSDVVINETSKSPQATGTQSPRTAVSEMKTPELLARLPELEDFSEAMSGLPLEKIMQLMKCVVSAAHKKVPTFDGSVDISARRVIQCVLNELMNEGGSADMVKQLCWLIQNVLFSKEYVKSIPSLLNFVDSSVMSELILKQENIMENLQNQMTPAKAINIALDVLSQKNVTLLPEEDLNKLNDILDSSRTCEELFDRFTRIIKERLSGNRCPR